MFPIRSTNPTSARPYVTFGLIGLNTLVFLFMAWGPVDQTVFTYRYGYLPAELALDEEAFAARLRQQPPGRPITDPFGRHAVDRLGRPLLQPNLEAIEAATAVPAWVNLLTAMFLHGGWWHLIGNMLYLWIFGSNIEDRLGPWLYVVFYVGTGVVGNLTHTFFDAGVTPLVGASGAVSGVMGAYILLFPRTRLLAIVPVGWYPMTVSLPAWMFLGMYFVVQNLYPATFGMGGNVAYWAHIGGFVSGAALIFVFPRRKRPPPPVVDMADEDADLVL